MLASSLSLTLLRSCTRRGSSTSPRAPQLARQRSSAKPTGSPAATLAERQKTKKYQTRLPSCLSLFAQSVQALAKVGRFLAQSDVRRKKHFLRKSAKLSCLLRNEMLKTRGRKTNELRNEAERPTSSRAVVC